MLSRKSLTIIGALASASLLPSAAYASSGDVAADVQALLEASYPADGPGASIVVTENGEVVYEGGRGLADIDAGTPITPDTVFRFASITKQFAAATIMQLVQEGKVSLDDPVSKFLPAYPEAGANVTVRQLLNHTSGIQSYTGIPGWMTEENTGADYTTETLIAEFKDMPSPSKPGMTWSYNNSGYVLLGAIIEKVTGRSWDGAIVSRISKPLGLSSIAGFGNESTVPNMATGYSADGEGNVTASQKVTYNVPHAAGGLRGTVTDLAGWANALHGGKVLDDDRYAMMVKRTELPDGETHPYGFGLFNLDVRGEPALGHSGGIFGFSTNSIYVPEQNLFVAVLSNSDSPQTDPGTVMLKAAAIAAGNPYEEFTAITPDLDALAPLFGVYAVGDNGTRQFYTRGGKLYTQRSGGSQSEIFAAGDNRFFYGPNSLTWFQMTTGEDGSPVMEMHQNGAEEIERATYKGPIAEGAAVPRETLESYVGTYTTMAGPMVITLGDDNILSAKLGGQPVIPLAAMSDTKFKVTVVDATVTFTSEDGAVTGLAIEQGGQLIPGERVADAD